MKTDNLPKSHPWVVDKKSWPKMTIWLPAELRQRLLNQAREDNMNLTEKAYQVMSEYLEVKGG